MKETTKHPELEFVLSSNLYEIPVGDVGVIVADAVDMFKFLLPKGIFRVVAPIYRYNENTWHIYNAEVNLVGIIINKGEYILAYGKDFLLETGKWNTTSMIKKVPPEFTEKTIKKKFARAKIWGKCIKN